MATVTAYQALDILSPGTPLRTTQTGQNSYTMSDDSYAITFRGTYFTVNRFWPADGTVTDMQITKSGVTLATIEGTNFRFNYNNVYGTAGNDSQTVFPIALSGNDRIYGSAQDDKL